MASNEILRLWRLAQIDNRLADVRQRAANLDVGQKLTAEIKQIEAKVAEVGGAHHSLSGESTDLELANGGIADKIKRVEKELYGGKVVAAKEVENLTKEIAALKRQSEKNDERLMELMELIPPAAETAAKWTRALEQRKQMLAKRQVEAKAERAALETEYKELAVKRPELAKIVTPPSLLARYELIKTKHAGLGMVEVNTKDNTCSGCGTHLPERTIQGLKDDKPMTCETCHRLLYYTEGLV
jgi:predicted  nucleic acid-binding Zn-ribbon protein